MKQTIEINAKTDGAIQGFDKVNAKAQQSGNAVKGMGEKVGKAGSALNALGSSAGQHIGRVGQVISALTNGPLSMLTAGIGAVVSAGVYLWDKLTLSAEEYAQKLDGIANRASAAYGKITSHQGNDTSFMDRLKELSNKDSLGAAGKSEAATLIEMLTRRYGDLGIQVDAVTGKITGLDEAQRKMAGKMQQERSTALGKKYSAEQRMLESEFVGAASRSNFSEWMRGTLGMSTTAKDARALFNGMNIDQIEAMAQKAFNNATTEDEIAKWNKVLNTVQKVRDTQNEMKSVRTDGTGNGKERAENAKKATSEEEAAAAKAQAAAKAERDRQAAIDKSIDGIEKELKYRQMILQGREREAAIEKALDQARANGPLSSAQEARIRAAAGALFDANKPAAAAAKALPGAGGTVSVFSAGLQNIGARGGIIRATEDAMVTATKANGTKLEEIKEEIKKVELKHFEMVFK